MSSFKVSLVTKAKEETEAFVKGVFPPECEVLFQTEEELRAGIAEIDIMVPGHINVDGDLIRRGTKLKMIHAGTGYNNVDMDACNEIGCYVAVTPNVAAQSVAELVFSGFGALKNQIRMWDNVMKNGGWKSSDFIGVPEFKGKTLGVVGYGNIGKCVGKIGRGFSMNVIAHDPFIEKAALKIALGNDVTVDYIINMASFETVIKDSDFISLHVPAQDKPMIGKKEFAKMKKGAGLINASRGGVIDEESLLDALDNGQLSFAGLDTFVNEPKPSMKVLMHPKVSLTPHIGAATKEAQDRIGTELAKHIHAILG